jgi:hypothetical protein
MNYLFIGIALLLISGSGAYSMFSAIRTKDETWWFRLIEFIFAFLCFLSSVFMASFLH